MIPSVIWVNCAEREVLCRDLHFAQRVEEGRLTDVRKTDDAHLQVVACTTCESHLEYQSEKEREEMTIQTSNTTKKNSARYVVLQRTTVFVEIERELTMTRQ